MISLNLIATPSDLQDALSHAAAERRLAMNITQADLAARAGVPVSTLKRFEQKGEVSLAALLRIAAVLDALQEFSALFPPVQETSLDQLPTNSVRKRARS